MTLPFSREAFLGVFERYNEAIWPLQVIFFALAVFTALSVFRKGRFTNIIAFSFLGFMWIWTGVVYHIIFFSPINPAARAFGAIFVLQGVIFLFAGAWQQRIQLEFNKGAAARLGIFLLLYALVIYPVWGLLDGQSYPATPTFGVPCPTVIFTFGILLLARHRGVPWYVITIPFLWSLVGFTAAISLGIPQDVGLVVAGLLSTLVNLFNKPRADLRLA